MSKKVFFFISFILVLTLSSGALGQDANHLCYWTDAGPDSNLWSDVNNWYTVDWNDTDDTWVKSSANSVPAADDVALIGRGADWFPYPNDVAALGPIGQCVLDSDAVCYQLYIGADPNDPNQANHLEMTGGSLTIRVYDWDWVGLGIGWIGTGSMTVHDGVVDIGPIGLEGGNLNIGGYDTGEGTLTMLGGEVYCYHLDCTDGDLSTGHLNMYGGTLYTTADVDWTEFWMGAAGFSPNSTCDVTDGKVIIKSSAINETGPEQELNWINLWIDEGKITVAGGTDPNADLMVDFDITNPGRTTLQAFAPQPGQAYHPSPAFGRRATLDGPTLTWTPGDGAASHIVYFSDSFADVNDGTAPNTPTGVASHTAGTLDWDTPYYWRVDEVGVSETVEGAVWSFKTDTHLNVDDMDSYDVATNPISYEDPTTGTWIDGFTNPTTSEVYTETNIFYGFSGKSMDFFYDNAPTGSPTKPRYAEIEAAISDLEIGSDWILAGAKSVRLRFYGVETNYGEPMYFGVEDSRGASSYAQVTYDDVNAIQLSGWQEWNIDLEDLNSAGVHLNDIQKVYLGIGVRGNTTATGEGHVYFDEIEIWPPRCRPETTFAEGDLSGDCYINNYDLEMVGRDWLLKSDWVAASEPVPGPVTHWRMDDSNTSTTVLNSGSLGTDFNGGFVFMDTSAWRTPGAPAPDNPDPNGALYFEAVAGHVNVPDFNSAPGGFTTDSATLTAWVKRNGTQVNFAGIVICTRLGEGWEDSVIQFGLSVGADWDEPVSTNKLKYHWEEDVGWAIPTELLIPDNQWTFCAVSVRPTDASVYMMPLGEAMQSTVVIQDHVVADMNQPILIGEDPRDFDGHRRWEGLIDDVRIYDYALTDEEIVYASQGAEGLIWYDLEPWRADIYDDDTIDFKDFAVMGDRWLDGPILWP